MKGGLAACLVAAAEAAQRGLRGDVVVTAVVDEELSSVGTQMALEDACGRTRRSSPSRPGCASASPTRASSPSRSRRTGRPPTARAPTSASTRSRRWATSSSGSMRSTASLRERPTHPLLGSGSLHAGVDRRRVGVLDLPRPLPAPGRAPDAARREPRPGRVGAPGPARRPRPRRRRLPGDVAGRRSARSVRGLPRRGDRAARRRSTRARASRSARRYWTDAALIARAARPDRRLRPRRRGRARRGRVGLDRGR